jgi:hypothetical protein
MRSYGNSSRAMPREFQRLGDFGEFAHDANRPAPEFTRRQPQVFREEAAEVTLRREAEFVRDIG